MTKIKYIAVFIFLFARPSLAGDIFELKSGERLEGKLVSESNDEITIQTKETKVVLPKSMIETMKIEEVHILLSDGRKLRGQIEKEDDQSVVLRMKLGALTINKMDIEELERRIIEKKPVIGSVDSGRKTGSDKSEIAPIEWPEPVGKLTDREVEQIDWHATYYIQKNEYKKALEKYQEILKARPKNILALYGAACIYSHLNRHSKAIFHLRKAIAAGFIDFDRIKKNPEFDAIRSLPGYAEIIEKEENYQLHAAKTKLRDLKNDFGEGYTYEINEERKLIFATNQSLEVLERMKEHLTKLAEIQYKLAWDYKPSYFITIICPDKKAFRKKVPNKELAGYYQHCGRYLICRDIGQTLDHEFTHALHYADMEARRIDAPTYIDEGFATLFESCTFRADAAEPRIFNRSFDPLRKAACRGRLVKWKNMLSLSYTQFHQYERSLHYDQSRGMFAYLYDTGNLKKWYENYCATFTRDSTGRIAWKKTFGNPLESIESNWIDWLLSQRYERPKLKNWDSPDLGVRFENYEDAIILYDLEDDSPADKAGLCEGDILFRADEKPIRKYNDMIDFLNSSTNTAKVVFKIMRGKKEIPITVILGKNDD